jgi:hypothetical protein
MAKIYYPGGTEKNQEKLPMRITLRKHRIADYYCSDHWILSQDGRRALHLYIQTPKSYYSLVVIRPVRYIN